MEETARTLDGRRMIMECPFCIEWYLGDRVSRFREVATLEERPVPAPLPLHLFWPHLAPDADYPGIRGEGMVVAAPAGSYVEVLRQLMPPSTTDPTPREVRSLSILFCS